MPKGVRKEKGPTPKEFEFYQEWKKDKNGSRAHRKCYPNSDPRYSRQNASEILAKPYMKALIKADQKALAERVKITEQELLEPLIEIATAKLDNFIDTAALECVSDLENLANSHAIKKIKIRRVLNDEGNDQIFTEIELHDKIKAVTELRKALGYDDKEEDKTNHNVNLTINHVGLSEKESARLSSPTININNVGGQK